MKKRNRIFLDIAIPVVLYSFIILIVQLGVGMVFGIIYYAAHAGTAAGAAAAGLEQFITDRSMLISLISNLLIICVVLIDTRIRRVKPLDYTLLAKPVGMRNIVMAVITGISFSVWLSLMLTMLPIPESLMSEYNDLSSAIGHSSVLDFVSVCLLGPLVEEMLFRGIIYKHLRICMPEYPAIILQAIVFAVLHGGSIIWVAYALVGGLLFGYIAMLTGSVRTSLAAHVAFNALSFLPLGDRFFGALAVLSPVLLIFAVRDIYKQAIK